MKSRSIIILLVLLLSAGISQAQEELPEFSADRPGYTTGTGIVPRHKVAWENGFGYESLPDGAHCLTLNNTMVRYGLFENMELRIGTDFLMFNDGEAMEPTFAFSPLTIGTKINVYESSNWLPSVSILAELQSPHVGSKELLPSHLAPSMYALFEHNINDWFWICYNVGLEWDGETAAPQTYLALATGFNITDDIGAFVETYNYLHPEGEHQFMTEFGLTWMPIHRLQFDLECDLDFEHFGKYYAIGGGVAWMIN
jgi:hypothetical protein